ncbi:MULTISPECIES: hypothetical protein [unclassified Sphingopyxis]|uniref:hypothetical protein n=1 Tax=unclassified Sphingopyxis TaxID=2614943 RepID=UPI002860D12D|nr:MULTISPECIES: hypothetical protein [unclassified Sphingopyxis]MDR6832455.1 hypothetical protein [Sphingopyxis sp. BE122]MDR7228198.1 hypothetical protein [Sphingopyxis sp. BE259]
MTRPTPRFALLALPLLALAAPLPAAAADNETRDAVATLNDPVAQDRMADTITAIVGALMQMPVGPLAEAVARVDPESDAAYIPHDATLGEVAGRDPDYADRMGADVRATTRMAGQAASALAVYAPVLKDMARDMAAQWEREREAARR